MTFGVWYFGLMQLANPSSPPDQVRGYAEASVRQYAGMEARATISLTRE